MRSLAAPGRAVPVALAASVLLLAGCGGDDEGPERVAGGAGKPSIGVAAGFQAKRSLVPKGDSATAGGEGESYVPTGEIVADSGFRPEVDGFSFENYGNDVEPENLEPANVQTLFGNVVCLKGTSRRCRLTPAAQTWMDNQNASMAGGHCEGFSVLALRMFDDKVDPRPSAPGGPRTWSSSTTRTCSRRSPSTSPTRCSRRS